MAEPLYNPSAPMPEESTPQRKSSWPVVLGVFMIIFGTFGALCSGIGGVLNRNYALLQKIKPFTPEQAEFMSTPLMRNWNMVTTVYLFIAAGLALLVLGCGIGLILRRPWAARLATTWAGLKIVLEVANAIGTFIIHSKVMQAIESGAVAADAVPEAMQKLPMSGSIISLIILLALPVITLIWLSRRETQEEIRRWS